MSRELSDETTSEPRIAAGDVEVDLREALSAGMMPAGPAESPAREPRDPVTEPPEPVTPAGAPTRAVVGLSPGEIYTPQDARGERSTGGLGTRIRGLLTSPPARREQHLDQQLRELRVRGLARGVTVALGSIKGGVGKTTLTLSLADMLAESLRCGVLVIDADLEWGTAADSTPEAARHGGTLSDVLRAREQIHSPGDLAPYLTALPRGAQLLAGPTDPNEIEALHPRDMQELLDLLTRFFPIVLLDLSPGIGLRGTIPRWAFGVADEIIAIATPTRGSLRRAERMLSYLSEHHHQPHLTLALNMIPHRPDPAIRRVIEIAETELPADAYAAIPRDDALTRQLDAGQLNIDQLQQDTRIALKHLTHQLATTWTR
jgi:MinD-like ATPase involved in chromosome partitioning or flagellar assembly